MRSLTLSTVAALALAAAACSSNTETDTAEANLAEDNLTAEALGTNDVATNGAAPAMPTDAAGFAAAAAAGDLYEVESAKLAAEKGTAKDIKEVANHIRTDHEKASAELKSLVGTAKVALAPALDAEKQAMLDELKAASGAEFDRKFLDQQRTAHQKAMALHQNYARSGDNEALKGFAAKTAGVVKGHLDHLNSIKL